MYLLDFVAHYPEFLHPERPYISFGGPWVHTSHRAPGFVSGLQYLPRGLIAKADVLASTINTYVAPVLGPVAQSSMAIATSLNFGSKPIDPGAGAPTEEEKETWRRMAKSEETVWEDLMTHMNKESLKGISTDAVMLARKADGMRENGWSDWGDYDALMPKFAEIFRARQAKLKVDIYFAEKDFMIGDAGTKGPIWFDSIWKQEPTDWIDFHSEYVKGTDHDNIFFLRFGAIRKVFENIRPLESEGR